MGDIATELFTNNSFKEKLPAEYINFLERRIFPEYLKYDDLSLKHQTHFKLWGSMVFIVSFLSLSIIGTGISFFEQIPRLFFLIELIFLFFIFIAYIVTRKSAFHSKWIDYRMKAEQLRINIFSILASKPKIFFEKADGDSQILERINKEIRLKRIEDVKEYIIKKWLEKQLEFHDKKFKSFSKKETFIKNSIRIIFVFAIIISLLHVLLTSHPYENILILLVLILPALGATLLGIRYHRDFSTISDSSMKMVEAISDFINKINHCKDFNELLKIIKRSEYLFVNELERWETIIRSREIELAL